MKTTLHIVEPTCECGQEHTAFKHTCAVSGKTRWITGCPVCDNHCPDCVRAPAVDASDHVCLLDEVLCVLQRIRDNLGNVPLMIMFESNEQRQGKRVAAVPYLAVNRVALDDDEPGKPIALVAVAEGNHPFGEVMRLRPDDHDWLPKS